MGLFRKKKLVLPPLKIDCHSHILPSVDDGILRMEDSLRVLDEYEKLGIEEVWLTPHVMEDVPNTTASLTKRYDDLQNAYSGPVKLHLAAEYMLDGCFAQRLLADDLLLMDGHPLVETSYYNPPIDFIEILENIKSAGYFPVLAHPERYMYMDRDDYCRLRDMGVMFQMNVGSFSGLYGSDVQSKARKIYEDISAPEYMGTDLHRYSMIKALGL